MKSNRLKFVALGVFLLVAYFASYLICRSIYATREDVLITYYNQSSIIGLVSHLVHAPLYELDRVMTGRYTTIGKWRGMRDEIAARETTAFVWFAASTVVGAGALFGGLRLFSSRSISRDMLT